MSLRWRLAKHNDGHRRICDENGDEVFRVNALNENCDTAAALALAAPDMMEALGKRPVMYRGETSAQYMARLDAWWQDIAGPAWRKARGEVWP